jgi:hypothetical protein
MAYLRGVRLPVWLAIETLEDCGGNATKAARLLRLPVLLLQGALAYAQAFPEEIAADRAAGSSKWTPFPVSSPPAINNNTCSPTALWYCGLFKRCGAMFFEIGVKGQRQNGEDYGFTKLRLSLAGRRSGAALAKQQLRPTKRKPLISTIIFRKFLTRKWQGLERERNFRLRKWVTARTQPRPTENWKDSPEKPPV